MVLMIVLGVLAAWLLVAVVLALLIGRAVRLADQRQRALMARRPAPTPSRVAVDRLPVRV